mmetsp:Transcript_68354/g.165333  ORF Transcript_68354/g.165333 Transcript_68354/m.165333 type:complete len:257 (+) Transcript_68354:270-1040(+)
MVSASSEARAAASRWLEICERSSSRAAASVVEAKRFSRLSTSSVSCCFVAPSARAARSESACTETRSAYSCSRFSCAASLALRASECASRSEVCTSLCKLRSFCSLRARPSLLAPEGAQPGAAAPAGAAAQLGAAQPSRLPSGGGAPSAAAGRLRGRFDESSPSRVAPPLGARVWPRASACCLAIFWLPRAAPLLRYKVACGRAAAGACGTARAAASASARAADSWCCVIWLCSRARVAGCVVRSYCACRLSSTCL